MRKLREKNKEITLYLPEELYQRLETYMLDHYGRTYGKNEVINLALSEFIEASGRSNTLDNTVD